MAAPEVWRKDLREVLFTSAACHCLQLNQSDSQTKLALPLDTHTICASMKLLRSRILSAARGSLSRDCLLREERTCRKIADCQRKARGQRMALRKYYWWKITRSMPN